jgi:3-oxoacyl-[acyl-carrier protein] reductase
MSETTDLTARVALVTGVSRRRGIAYTVATRLVAAGANVYATGWPPHDEAMPWGADPQADDQADEALPDSTNLEIDRRDLEDPNEPAALIDSVVERFGAIDIVVAVHARSSSSDLRQTTAEELDRCWAANVRSVVLLAKRFAERHDTQRQGGRMIWFTSGQHLAPMPGELPYAISKGALQAMTNSLAEPLADAGIVANCINPGPVDTGWADDEIHEIVAKRFPAGRWGTPADVANLIEFLLSDRGSWISGQVLNSEGGFRRH